MDRRVKPGDDGRIEVDVLSYCAMSSYKSRQSGFWEMIKSTFHSRGLMFFSRCMASQDGIVVLEINEPLNPVALCETLHQAFTVFVDTTHQIVGDAYIERSARTACKDIHPIRHGRACHRRA